MQVEIQTDRLEEFLRRVVREELAALPDSDTWFSSAQAAEYLGVTVGHLHNLRERVPSYKVGGRRRYRRSELDAWMTGGA